MHEVNPSRTALRVALRRAAHQLHDAKPLVFDDPLAVRILGKEFFEEVKRTPDSVKRPFSAALRAFMVVRARLAEDTLAAGVRDLGVRQYLVLGAGLDTFACRNPHADVRVFEVDHPATQAWKRGQLETAGIALPPSLRFVSVDFETQQLGERLAGAGLRADERAFFSWLGVSMYLTRAAIGATLGYVAGLPRGSGIVFDYAVPPAGLSPVRRLVVHALLKRVAAAGEPWKTFFEPRALVAELRALGFTELEDLGTEELNARFFGERSDGLRTGALGRVMCARS